MLDKTGTLKSIIYIIEVFVSGKEKKVMNLFEKDEIKIKHKEEKVYQKV